MTRCWSKLGKVMRKKTEQKERRGKERRKEEDTDARDEDYSLAVQRYLGREV
jgi:hypothetical protein